MQEPVQLLLVLLRVAPEVADVGRVVPLPGVNDHPAPLPALHHGVQLADRSDDVGGGVEHQHGKPHRVLLSCLLALHVMRSHGAREEPEVGGQEGPDGGPDNGVGADAIRDALQHGLHRGGAVHHQTDDALVDVSVLAPCAVRVLCSFVGVCAALVRGGCKREKELRS